MPEPLDFPRLGERLVAHLRQHGPASSGRAQEFLEISQPSFSRLVAGLPEVVRIGGGPRTRYAVLRREPIEVWRVTPEGTLEPFTTLRLLATDGGLTGERAVPFDDLPWWLEDARPQGFLGRLVPRRHPELPPDIRLWSADTVLDYLTEFGWDVPGDLLVGEAALQQWLRHAERSPVEVDDAAEAYPRLARAVLTHRDIGSSAGGEQSKFLATCRGVAVLVKFSPVADTPVARRIADLLRAEHHAAQTLRASAHDAARTRLIEAEGRCFLEVERFDRVGWPGRRGVVSLAALDAEFSGLGSDWVRTCQELVRVGVLDGELLSDVQLRHAFGTLIHNTDMHLGNLSFFRDGTRATALCPSYDMLPMRFFPRGHELVEVEVQPPPPRATPGWRAAWGLACQFWRTVSEDVAISEDFRRLARQCLEGLEAQATTIRRLPA